MKKLCFAAALLALASCSPAVPTPVPTPAPTSNSCVINGTGNVCNIGNGAPAPAPSVSPSAGPFVRPDYVKITQFGESCGNDANGVPIQPSGQDRSVRIGCTKALTLSPKCHQTNGGPDIDCPVPDNAAPDSFEVSSGGEHITFSAFGSASVAAFSGPHMMSDAFNRRATGVSVGAAVITGSYAGIRAQSDFILTVVK